MAKKNKYYVVWDGLDTGIFSSWATCQQQIKGYPGAKYKGFPTKEEAEEAYGLGYTMYKMKASESKKAPIKNTTLLDEPIVWESISVDAACSGNPGVMEYQGVDTKTKAQIFYKKFQLGTNNIGEFLALVHALAIFKKTGDTTPIYTDSKIAQLWVKNKKCKTKLDYNARTRELHDVIARAEQWLKSNTYTNEIMKWDTKSWGEIPADFGRK